MNGIAEDMHKWRIVHGRPPMLIIAHADAPFAAADGTRLVKCNDEDGNDTDTKFDGIRVLTLEEFYDLHADRLLDKEEEE